MKHYLILPFLVMPLFASALTDPAFDRFMSTTVGNKTTITYGSDGTPLAGVKGASVVARTSDFAVSRGFALSGAHGSIQAAATLPVSKSAVARMVKVAAVGMGLVGGPVAIAAMVALPFLAEWMLSAKVRVNPEPSEEYPFLGINDGVIPFSVVWQYSNTAYAQSPTPLSACQVVNANYTVSMTSDIRGTCLSSGIYAAGYVNKVVGCLSNGKVIPPPIGATNCGTNSTEVPFTLDAAVARLESSPFLPAPGTLLELAQYTPIVPDDGVIPDVTIVGDTRGTPYNVVEATKVDPSGTTVASSDCVQIYVPFLNTLETIEECIVRTTAPDGTTTTETVKKQVDATVTPPAGAASSPGATLPEQPASAPVDFCVTNPESIACASLGAAPAATPVPNVNKPLTITKDAGWGPENGSCPAPRQINLSFGTMSMPWDLICGFASGIKPLVIGFAYLSAAFTFFGIGRKS